MATRPRTPPSCRLPAGDRTGAITRLDWPVYVDKDAESRVLPMVRRRSRTMTLGGRATVRMARLTRCWASKFVVRARKPSGKGTPASWWSMSKSSPELDHGVKWWMYEGMIQRILVVPTEHFPRCAMRGTRFLQPAVGNSVCPQRLRQFRQLQHDGENG